MSRSRLLLPLLAVLFILGACQSEGKLTGEVFIVTEGGSNVELGDTEVRDLLRALSSPLQTALSTSSILRGGLS